MKITAVTEDQMIIINGVPVLTALYGGFHMMKGEWAVHFDTDKEVGEIEFLDNRQNQVIDQVFFDAHYGWLVDEHKRIQALEQAVADEQEALIDARVSDIASTDS